MAVMDEFKEERDAVKNGPLKQKLRYFLDYYKWHFIISICAISMMITFIYQIATYKDTAFTAVMMNAYSRTEEGVYEQEYAAYAGIDLAKYNILFDTSIFISDEYSHDVTSASAQKLTTLSGASALDVMVTDTDSFQVYANLGSFHDLRSFLSEEQLAGYEPYFYYVDKKTMDEIAAANDTMDDTFVPTYPDPAKPDEMTEPIPVGIYLDHCEKLLNSYDFSGEQDSDMHVVVGVYTNTQHADHAMKFIDFIFEE